MYLAKYLASKNAISSILVRREAGLVSGEQAAGAILAVIVPTMERAIGMERYFDCAKGWLTQIILAEPRLTLNSLVERLQVMREISPEMRRAIGGITGRLTLLCSI